MIVKTLPFLINTGALFFREKFEFTLFAHLIDLLQTINTGFDGLKVSQRAAKPALGDKESATAKGGFLDWFLRLFFGANENQSATIAGNFAYKVGGAAGANDGLLQINDVNSTTIAVNIVFHLGVPALSLVTEVDARIE